MHDFGVIDAVSVRITTAFDLLVSEMPFAVAVVRKNFIGLVCLSRNISCIDSRTLRKPL